MVVHMDDEVVLECITNVDVTCAWKVGVPELGADGFLNNRVSKRTFTYMSNAGDFSKSTTSTSITFLFEMYLQICRYLPIYRRVFFRRDESTYRYIS